MSHIHSLMGIPVQKAIVFTYLCTSHKFKTQLSICFETLQIPLWFLKPSCFIPRLRLIHNTTWNHSFLRNPSVSTYNKGKPIGTRWPSYILHLHSQLTSCYLHRRNILSSHSTHTVLQTHLCILHPLSSENPPAPIQNSTSEKSFQVI